MGTDIHMFVERRTPAGTWEFVDNSIEKIIPCTVCKGAGKLPPIKKKRAPEEQCFYCDGKGYYQRPYRTRNYDLFGILANVRNGTWGEALKPISEPKGLPEDLSDGLRERKEQLGYHSFSWVTLEELLAYDWTRTNHKYGCVPIAEAVEWRKKGKAAPSTYCADSNGYKVSQDRMDELVGEVLALAAKSSKKDASVSEKNAIRFVVAREMSRAIDDGDIGENSGISGLNIYANMSWTETYADLAGHFYSEVIPALHQKLGPPADVRLVFGFDS